MAIMIGHMMQYSIIAIHGHDMAIIWPYAHYILPYMAIEIYAYMAIWSLYIHVEQHVE